MWLSETDGLKWSGIVQTVRSAEQLEAQREKLEYYLINKNWNSIRRPWMHRKDSLFQSQNDRILIDHIGIFLYRRTTDGWHRFAAFSGYDRKIILSGFERWNERKR
jgi:hypothetical protein